MLQRNLHQVLQTESLESQPMCLQIHFIWFQTPRCLGGVYNCSTLRVFPSCCLENLLTRKDCKMYQSRSLLVSYCKFLIWLTLYVFIYKDSRQYLTHETHNRPYRCSWCWMYSVKGYNTTSLKQPFSMDKSTLQSVRSCLPMLFSQQQAAWK